MGNDPIIGQVLQNRYKVIDRVAAGGMGVIYRGERVELGRPVAIKFVHAWAANDPKLRKRFEIEVRAMGRIHHPSCVSITDFGAHEGAPYVVMDFVEGETLADVLDEKPLPVNRALAITEKILAGLAHAHDKGIVHRDVKPRNIMVTESAGFADDVRILDFGLAKLRETTTGLTAGMAVGTPSYMAPEQTVGDPVDARTDVYAAGLLLYEMLAGEPPFWSDESREVMRMQRETPPKPIEGVAPQLWAILARALAKNPAERYASAGEFATALREHTRTPTPPVHANPSPGRRPPWVAIAGAGAAIVALVVLVIVLVASSGADNTAKTAVDAAVKPGQSARWKSAELSAIETLIANKQNGKALKKLRRLKQRQPGNARVHYLLGQLHFDVPWWTEALKNYAEAIRLDASFKADELLLKDVIYLFRSPKYVSLANKFLQKHVGKAAVPLLQKTALEHSSYSVRQRAKRALDKLSGS